MDDVAQRLRKVRELHGLSQRELAKRSGVSNATISLIEHRQTNPSVGMLKRILDAVPVSMSDFFSMDLASQDQVFFSREDLVEIGRGSISYRQVGAGLRTRNLQLLYETYRPGSDTGQSMLRHEAEEGAIVIQGRLEVTVGDQTRVLGPGDAYLFDSRIPHRFRNVGREDCVLVSACTPPSF